MVTSSHPRSAEPLRVAILSGELSGDLVGAALARDLQALQPDVSLWGMGSRHMRAAGVELLYDSADWAAIGVVDALRVYPKLRYRVLPAVLRHLAQARPHVVVLIDFGAFNMRIARWCKARGLRVFYYFPPGSWRRSGAAKQDLARFTDRIATPFPWSAERLRCIGADATFVGHPLLDIARPTLTREEFADRLGLNPEHPLIGLLPGSRRFEIEHNTGVMLEASARIARETPEAQFVFGIASPTALPIVQRIVQSALAAAERETTHGERADTESEPAARRGSREQVLATPEGLSLTPQEYARWLGSRRRRAQASPDAASLPVVLAQDLTYDIMAHSDALLVCSGTATLEAAIIGTPMVILYRGSRLMQAEAAVRRIRPEHIGMPNIVAGRRIVPEYIQNEATPARLAEEVLALLSRPDERARVKRDLAEVRAALGEPGASARTARMVLALAEGEDQHQVK